MKCAIVTDLHFGYGSNSDDINSGIQKFFYSQFIPYCKSNDVDAVFITGDLFENRTVINVRTMNIAQRVVKSIAEVTKVFITIGNHDLYFKNSNSLDSAIVFDGIKNVEVIRKPKQIQNIALFPWVVAGEEEDFKNELEEFGHDCNIALGHFDMVGFAMSSSKTSEHGFETGVFKDYELVVSGHYHSRSITHSGNTEFVYLGSPYQLNRGDIGEERGFMILDTETRDYTFVKNEMSPRFSRLVFPNKFLKSDVTGNFVDIIVNCDDEKYSEKMFDKYLEQVVKNDPIATPKIQIIASVMADGLDFDVELENMATTTKLLMDYVNVVYDALDNKHELMKKIMYIHEQVTQN